MLTWLGALGGRLSSAPNCTTDHRNARTMRPVASHPARGEPSLRPTSMSSAAPTSGSSGMIPARLSRSRAFTRGAGRARASALQDPEIVGGGGATPTEARPDGGQPNPDFSPPDHQRDEHT